MAICMCIFVLLKIFSYFISLPLSFSQNIFQCLQSVNNLLGSKDVKMNKTQALSSRITVYVWGGGGGKLDRKINDTVKIYHFFRLIFNLFQHNCYYFLQYNFKGYISFHCKYIITMTNPL